ncbi:MAG: glycosyltransferase family 4 protein [bacterium]|nr:glycosyltransferase family 4 protein [bacterium]
MRILILNHNQENFGTFYRCLFHAKHLARRGHQVTLLCASGSTFDPLMKWRSVEPGLTLVTLPRIKYHQFFSGQLFRTFPALAQVLLGRYDVCHAFTVAQTQIAVPAWVAKMVRHKRLIIDWDDLWGGGFAEEHSGLIAKVLGWHERYFLQYADHITYVSEKIAQEIDQAAQKYPAISEIARSQIPNGANAQEILPLDRSEARGQLKVPQERKILLSMANTYTESLVLMLQAFEQALQQDPEIYLYLLGEAPVPPEYQAQYDRVSHRVERLGKRPFAQVPQWLAVADGLILPMEDNPIEWARFPMRFGDYLCAARPILSNAVGEVKRYLEQYQAGLVSPPSDAAALGKNMLRIFSEPQMSANLGEAARKLAEGDLNWERVIDQVEAIYRGDL